MSGFLKTADWAAVAHPVMLTDGEVFCVFSSACLRMLRAELGFVALCCGDVDGRMDDWLLFLALQETAILVCVCTTPALSSVCISLRGSGRCAHSAVCAAVFMVQADARTQQCVQQVLAPCWQQCVQQSSWFRQMLNQQMRAMTMG
jgi:hypothetical protein